VAWRRADFIPEQYWISELLEPRFDPLLQAIATILHLTRWVKSRCPGPWKNIRSGPNSEALARKNHEE
jgi:hypothetical protein